MSIHYNFVTFKLLLLLLKEKMLIIVMNVVLGI